MRRKIWLGVGLAVTTALPAAAGPWPAAAPLRDTAEPLVAGNLAGPTLDTTRPAIVLTATKKKSNAGGEGGEEGEGGEGGEGGESGQALQLNRAPADVAYLARLSMLRAYMTVAADAIAGGHAKVAAARIHSARESLYEPLEAEFAKRKVTTFEEALRTYEASAKKTAHSAADDYALVIKGLDLAEAALPEDERTKPSLALAAAVQVLKVVAADYGVAYAGPGNPFKAPNEYRDARALASEAARLISGARARMVQEDAKAAEEIDKSLAALLAAFPSADPPERPLLSGAELFGLVSQIELHASRFKTG